MASVLGAGATALAQTAPPVAGGSASSVEEIVVTAQRREERLVDVPAAVTAVTSGELQQLHITETRQLTQVTPGLNFTQSVYSPQPTIRGIGSRGVNAGEESEVPIYIDGVYQSFLPAAELQFNDVERVEVLKGPQGALFGRNAMGGAISIITRTPTAEPHGDLDVSYGSYNQVIAKAYLSGGTDKVAASVAAVSNTDDGYIHDLVNGKSYGQTGDVAVRGKLVANPTDRITLTAAVSYVNDAESTGEAFRNLDGNTLAAGIPGNVVATAPYTAALTFRPYNKIYETNVALTGVFRFDGFDVTAITSYEDAKLKVSADADATPPDIVNYVYSQYSRNEYNEIYAQSHNDGPLSWIGGFVYYHDISGNPQTNINIAGVGDLVTIDRIETQSYAAYGQVTYKFTDQWSATVGGRYTTEKKSFSNLNGLGGVPASFVPLSNSATFSKFTPSGILQYQPNSRLNFYAKAGQAFKSGVFNPGANSVLAAQPVQPETLTQYEIGMKSDLSRLVQFNLSAYYTNYQNLQSATRTPQGQSVLQNAGRATIYGLEAEAFVHPVDHLNLRLGLSALHGTYSSYTNADVYFPITAVPAAAPCTVGGGALLGGNTEQTCNVNGKTIMRTPTFQADVGGDYTIPMETGDITLSANASYQGKSYWDAANVFEEHPYTVVDARLAWRSPNRRVGVAIWGENLSNALYSVTEVVGSFGTSQVVAKPRTGGVEITYDW